LHRFRSRLTGKPPSTPQRGTAASQRDPATVRMEPPFFYSFTLPIRTLAPSPHAAG
jgi:hypothetical protein